MRVNEARELFRQHAATYFASGTVVLSGQSRSAKNELPLILITTGNVNRPTKSNDFYVNGECVGSYLSQMEITVDLFTHGKPVYNEQTLVAYENSALDDMLCFADYLNSPLSIAWSHNNDVAIIVDNNVQDLTGLVNDDNYEYRARMTLQFYFTQRAIGAAGVLLESSLTKDSQGQYIINPQYEVTSSGGGSEALKNEVTGYFTSVNITEENNG